MNHKNIFFFSCLFVFFLSFSSTSHALPEGKSNPEIDLPIARPEIKKQDDWFDPIEEDRVVFVIDASGSMYGSRIAKAKEEVSKAIQALPENIKFSIVYYNCTVRVWNEQLVDAGSSNKASALSFVASLSASGGTATGPAVQKALELDRKNKLIVLLTDGAPNCISSSSYGDELSHLNIILRANQQSAQIDVYAIQPWSGPYRQFCQDLAQRSGGKYKEVN